MCITSHESVTLDREENGEKPMKLSNKVTMDTSESNLLHSTPLD